MPEKLTAMWAAQFRRRLLAWYKSHSRPLPWRETHDPYAIWISEIMLQQTQVATVIGYYTRFLTRFPDVASLAAADQQEVLTYWAGLGYYRRARQLHLAAQKIVSDYNGKFPRPIADVLSLPGIGRYTAGAIVSFAYGTRAPILEANTLRLYSRLIGLREDPKQSPAQAQLWEFAEHILPQTGAQVGVVNQATMELGSLVCLPKEPNCDICPVAMLCSAYATGTQADIPLASKPKSFTPLTHALVVLQRRGKTLMRQNQDGAWWSGLWDFPRVDLTQQWSSNFDDKQLDRSTYLTLLEVAFEQQLGLHCRSSRFLKTIRHSVTRYRIGLHCFSARLEAGRLPDQQIWKWIDLSLTPDIPLTSTAEKLRKWLVLNPIHHLSPP